ncbi:TetR/AcrR family transcriptional regulator [Desulfospira joergensenii]|uniref:TetR/AcrR family transcriptional regulator n=1 Tax=Desulfospira joergensenii TaxID=53329 RepID=UPI0003B34402|nr:TetR/AcrR family transcriptional regulator [Desulfospira joergensenii]
MAKSLFDRNEVIDKSIQLFWKNGFSFSSMQQVVKITGLNPGSIYHAFGSKEDLFREALEAYGRKSLALISSTLEAAPSVGEGILMILEKNIQESAKKDYCSCFLVKTQLELAAAGNRLHVLASEKLGEIEALYESYLEKEFGQPLSRKRATSLMINIFGMRVYGYRQGSAERMRQGLREGLPWLPWS